jgi:Flp pilus assembly protein TadG
MNTTIKSRRMQRGNVAVLLCFMLPALLGLVALAVDYGFLLFIRTDLQRVADQAALAAVRELEPATDGTQDLAAVYAALQKYASANAGYQVTILDSDVEIGRFEPATVYSNFTIRNDGILDTVRVTVRRSDLANSSVALYFARIFGSNQSDVSATATAVLQKATYLQPGADILPITFSTATWDARQVNEVWTIYGDGRMTDQYGELIPGNWGTIDIGSGSNSSADLVAQIDQGLRQVDLDQLYANQLISSPDRIDCQEVMTLNGDTGLSSGIKDSVREATGLRKLVPIFGTMAGSGGNLDFTIVKWGVVELAGSHWAGNNNSSIDVAKSYIYDGDLRPHPDLSNTTDVIENAYTTPVLVK